MTQKANNKKFFHFPGGVHPPEEKDTRALPIEELPAPEKVFIPLSQHIGAMAKPIISQGDRVKIGTKIAEVGGYVSAPIHASISGTVMGVVDYPHPTGRAVPAIEIEGDGKDAWDDRVNSNALTGDAIKGLTPGKITEIIKEAGIVGMGGAAFPTHVKLTPPKDKPIDTLIINGAECEPYLTADHRLMLEEPLGVICGSFLLGRALGVKNIIIAVEENKADAARVLVNSRGEEPIDVVVLPVRYPQGAEKQLIKTVLDRRVPAGGLPMDVGVVVQNVGTAFASYEAIYRGKPLVSRVVTVTGDGIRVKKNLLVRVGTPVSEVIDYCGGFTGEVRKILVGGPMMGIAQYDLLVPVIKGTSGVLVFTDDEIDLVQEGPCLRCGNCVDVCPMRLSPFAFSRYTKLGFFGDAERFDVTDCIECGCCAYECPSRIPLVHYAKFAKAEIAAKRRKA